MHLPQSLSEATQELLFLSKRGKVEACKHCPEPPGFSRGSLQTPARSPSHRRRSEQRAPDRQPKACTCPMEVAAGAVGSVLLPSSCWFVLCRGYASNFQALWNCVPSVNCS